MKENSKLTKLARTAITPVRLGWHGVAISLVGAGLFFYGGKNGIDPILNFGAVSALLGPFFYRNSLKGYLKMKKNLNKYGSLDEESLTKNYFLGYCTRQGSRTAAVNVGLTEQYDLIRSKFDGDQMFKWFPHW